MGCCQSKQPESEPLLAKPNEVYAPAPASQDAHVDSAHTAHVDTHAPEGEKNKEEKKKEEEKKERAQTPPPAAPSPLPPTPASTSSPAAVVSSPSPSPSPSPAGNHHVGGDKSHEGLSVVTGGGQETPTGAEESKELPYVDLGEIRLSFQYMNTERCLILTIHEARKVDPKHAFVFARANLITDEDLSVEKFKTASKSIKDPKFEDIFTFKNLERAELAKFTLAVVLFESMPLGDMVVGEYRFELKRLNAEHGLPRYYPLKMFKDRPKSISENLAAKLLGIPNEPGMSLLSSDPPTPSTPSTPNVEKEKKSLRSMKKQHNNTDTASISSQGSRHEDLGELTVKVSYSTQAKKLSVSILEVNEAEFRAHPDHQTVYINASLTDHMQKQKSKVYPRGDKFAVSEVFVFDIAPEELPTKAVDVSLKVASNTFIGMATIDLNNREGDFEFECVYSLESRSFMKSLGSLSSVNLFRRNSTSSINSKKGEDEVVKTESFGEISVGLRFNSHEKKIKVTVIEGRNLKSCDSNGFSDPYVEVKLIPEESEGKKKKKSQEFKTKIVKKSLNPRYDETFEFPLAASDLSTKKIQLLVWDHDSVGRDFMGEAIIDLTSVSMDQLDKAWHTLGRKTTGEMKVRFVVDENETQLEVTIIAAKELIPLRSNGHIDAYVKVYLQPDTKKLTKRKTSTKKKITDEAKWDEKVSYNLRDVDDYQSRSIVVTVHDEDKLKNNPEVGEFTIPLKDVLTEKKVVGWYSLAK